MFKPPTVVPGRGGFYSLFDLPATIFNPAVLKKLGEIMAQAGIPGSSPIDSGYVYLAQLITHDISKRASPPAGHEFSPAGELEQRRTSELDLDNVYGEGFFDGSVAVDETTGEMLLGTVIKPNGQPGSQDDLPRGPDLKARIGDERDDENLLVAQLHVQFLKLHNHLVRKIRKARPQLTPRQLFDEARQQLVLLYQDVVLYDFLPAVLDPNVWAAVVRDNHQHLLRPVRAEMARIPVEFAAAAFRFAHAMVRPDYTIAKRSSLALPGLFEMTGQGKFGGQLGLPEKHVVDWRLFFSGLCPESELPFPINKALPIDPTVAVPTPQGSISEVDLRTGNRSLIAAAQDIVAHTHPVLGLAPLNEQQLNPRVRNSQGALVPLLSMLDDNGTAADPFEFTRKSPLWYYVLCEALALNGGNRLGPLGSQIVAETLHALIYLSSTSVLHETMTAVDIGINPTGRIISGRQHFRMIDLLKAVGPQSQEFEASVSDLRPPLPGEAGENPLKLQNVA